MNAKGITFIFLFSFCAISQARVKFIGIHNELSGDNLKSLLILKFSKKIDYKKFPFDFFKLDIYSGNEDLVKNEIKKGNIDIDKNNINIFGKINVPYTLVFDERKNLFISEKGEEFLIIKIGGNNKWYSVEMETKNNKVNFVVQGFGNSDRYTRQTELNMTKEGVWLYVKTDGTAQIIPGINPPPITELFDYLKKNKTIENIGQKAAHKIAFKRYVWNNLLGQANTTELMSELWKGNLDKAKKILIDGAKEILG